MDKASSALSPSCASVATGTESVACSAEGSDVSGSRNNDVWIPPSLRRARAAAAAAAELASREESQKNHSCERQVSVQLCVVDAFWRCLSPSQPDVALAGVHALAAVVNHSPARTVEDLFVHLKAATEGLEAYAARTDVMDYLATHTQTRRQTTLPLQSACWLYQQFAARHAERKPDITVEELKALMIAQAAKFASRVSQNKETIAELGHIMFSKDQMLVLTHGRSSCVEKLLTRAWKIHKKRFSVLVTEADAGPPWTSSDEASFVARLCACGIPARRVPLSSISKLIGQADVVVVGAEAVAENGGIINRSGTATVAAVANSRCVPVFVVCEASKFSRVYPISQRDPSKPFLLTLHSHPKVLAGFQETLDYTGPELITLLFTDLGLFTPSGVSDELTTLYQK